MLAALPGARSLWHCSRAPTAPLQQQSNQSPPVAGLGTSQCFSAISPIPVGSVTTAVTSGSVPGVLGRDAQNCAVLTSPLLLLWMLKHPPKP